MGPDIMARAVAGVMTARPITVEPEMLAASALALMNGRNITALVVRSAGRPVGVLHMHALLAAGVA
jgi:arabinose-5-phosphate isomerase